MEINEALDILLGSDKVNEALSIVHDKKSEVADILVEKLQRAIYDMETGAEQLPCVLSLIAELEVKTAFPDLIKILELKQGEVFWGMQEMTPSFFGTVLFKTASNEEDILLLENYALGQDIQGMKKLSAYYAVRGFYARNYEKRESLEAFHKKMLSNFNEAGFDYFENHSLILNVVAYSLQEHFFDLYEDIKALLIKLIIECPRGYNFSGFKDYFSCLYSVDRLIPAKLHDVKECLKNLRYCTDERIFQFDDLADVGKYLFSKILGEVEAADCDIIKIAVKQLSCYPDSCIPTNDIQYYEKVCYYLNICEIPKNVYVQAKEIYNSIFCKDYLELINKIETVIEETKRQKAYLSRDIEDFISKTNKDRSVQKNIETGKAKLAEHHFKEKRLNALYKNENSRESGLLVYYLKKLKKFFESFCEDIDNENKVDEKLREISIKCIGSGNITIEEKFAQYKKVIEQLNFLVDASPYVTLYKIFYKVKFFPFAEKIQLEFWAKLKDDEYNKGIKSELEKQVSMHPLNPQLLYASFEDDITKYCETLENSLCETLAGIREYISNSICLNKRKAVIEKCLLLIENRDDEVAINLLPIQIEGLFVDLLEYSTIYESIDDISQFKTILNLDLVRKIDFGQKKDINISFEAIAYFSYYFNNIVRNTVAHGNYNFLVTSGRTGEEGSIDNVDNSIIRRVIALELLLDLQYLVHMIAKINEIDTANEYIAEVYEYYVSSDKEENGEAFYRRMFEDLCGIRDRYKLTEYKPGIFVTYEPLQLLHWIFSPYYEKYLDKEKLDTIRTTVCSCEFWNYVEERLSRKEVSRFGRYDAKKFQAVIKRMLQLDLENDVRQMLVKVNSRNSENVKAPLLNK